MNAEAWVVFSFGAAILAFREVCTFLERREWHRERSQLLNKVISENAIEYQARQAADLAVKPVETTDAREARGEKLRSRSRPDSVEAAIAGERDVLRQAIAIIGENRERAEAKEV